MQSPYWPSYLGDLIRTLDCRRRLEYLGMSGSNIETPHRKAPVRIWAENLLVCVSAPSDLCSLCALYLLLCCVTISLFGESPMIIQSPAGARVCGQMWWERSDCVKVSLELCNHCLIKNTHRHGTYTQNNTTIITMSDFRWVLTEIGEFGLFQKCLLLSLCITSSLCLQAWASFVTVRLGACSR